MCVNVRMCEKHTSMSARHPTSHECRAANTKARDAHYALAHRGCLARSAAPHSGARRALLRQGPRAHRRGACTLGPRCAVLGTPRDLMKIPTHP